jgi:hypothetical protein
MLEQHGPQLEFAQSCKKVRTIMQQFIKGKKNIGNESVK